MAPRTRFDLRSDFQTTQSSRHQHDGRNSAVEHNMSHDSGQQRSSSDAKREGEHREHD
jgi:hypothetical protein